MLVDGEPIHSVAGLLEKFVESEQLVPQVCFIIQEFVENYNHPRLEAVSECEQDLASRTVDIAIDVKEADGVAYLVEKSRQGRIEPTPPESTVAGNGG